MRRKAILLISLVVAMAAAAQTGGRDAVASDKRAPVFITAGQSNTDGRVYAADMPAYLAAGYRHLHYADVTTKRDGRFGERTFRENRGRWSYCDVVNHCRLLFHQSRRRRYVNRHRGRRSEAAVVVCRAGMAGLKQGLQRRCSHGTLADKVAHGGLRALRGLHAQPSAAGI